MEMENKSEQTYIVLFFASLMYSKMEITTFFFKNRHGEAPTQDQTNIFLRICDNFFAQNPDKIIG